MARSELKVDAYEPNPLTFDTLNRNIRENGLESRVRVFRDAVTGQDGVVLLWSGDSSVLSSTSAERSGSAACRCRCRLFRSIARSARTGATHVALKIDAEGAEVEMLESASEATLAAIDEMALEYHRLDRS